MSRRKQHNSFQFIATILIATIATIWLGILGNFVWQQMAPVNQLSEPSPTPASPSRNQTPDTSIPANPLPDIPPIASSPQSPAPTISEPAAPAPQPPSSPVTGTTPKYNHLPYDEAQSGLTRVGSYYERDESLVNEVAEAFWSLEEAAKASGINLGPISGFRTVSDQQQLFSRQVSKHDGSEAAAARLSAPPGYSEHHTGYTIDIRDRDNPDTDLKYALENTRAYAWLRDNACQYGFELSFPDNNVQGVSFEPWHWRYIGSPQAEQIFANARQRYPAATNCAAS